MFAFTTDPPWLPFAYLSSAFMAFIGLPLALGIHLARKRQISLKLAMLFMTLEAVALAAFTEVLRYCGKI